VPPPGGLLEGNDIEGNELCAAGLAEPADGGRRAPAKRRRRKKATAESL
jgi:hypothetical protein